MSTENFLVVGSYTPPLGSGSGITTFARDAISGNLLPRSSYSLESPSYVAAHPALPIVYAVSESEPGVVSTFEITPAGQLVLRARTSSGGAGPCHCTVTADGARLIVCNYGDGTVAVLPLDRGGVADSPPSVVTRHGSGPDPDRQDASHPHLSLPREDGTFLVADLGTDELVRYRPGGTGPATPAIPVESAALAPGTGPRQVALLPKADPDAGQDESLVVVGELSSVLTVLHHGIRTPVASRFTMAAAGRNAPSDRRNYPAHVEVTPGGAVIYLSNRGADCVTSFAVEADRLRYVDRVGVGAWPRHFAVVAAFLYVAAERGDRIDLVRADHRTGLLESLGTVADVASPACVLPVTVPT
ncbi:MAG: lactonase family protein [Humibacillus sp.]|nr:lactonase family protein [Humibacillus sp.]MDN5779210.1 lactonase family protein [Humibacillus sp.]